VAKHGERELSPPRPPSQGRAATLLKWSRFPMKAFDKLLVNSENFVGPKVFISLLISLGAMISQS